MQKITSKKVGKMQKSHQKKLEKCILNDKLYKKEQIC